MDMKIRTENSVLELRRQLASTHMMVNVCQDAEAHVIVDASPAQLHKQSLV